VCWEDNVPIATSIPGEGRYFSNPLFSSGSNEQNTSKTSDVEMVEMAGLSAPDEENSSTTGMGPTPGTSQQELLTDATGGLNAMETVCLN
jgi:hypothetical protein